jgi:hypothetical protein
MTFFRFEIQQCPVPDGCAASVRDGPAATSSHVRRSTIAYGECRVQESMDGRLSQARPGGAPPSPRELFSGLQVCVRRDGRLPLLRPRVTSLQRTREAPCGVASGLHGPRELGDGCEEGLAALLEIRSVTGAQRHTEAPPFRTSNPRSGGIRRVSGAHGNGRIADVTAARFDPLKTMSVPSSTGSKTRRCPGLDRQGFPNIHDAHLKSGRFRETTQSRRYRLMRFG